MHIQSPSDEIVLRVDNRKQVVLTTLAYIQQLQAEVETNSQWLDLNAQKQRYALLSDLRSWYENELEQLLDTIVFQATLRN